MATTRDLAGSSGLAVAPAGAEDVTRELVPPQNHQKTDSCFIQQLCPKQRLRWTPEMHELFIKAIADLGGAKKATPKSISELMGVEGITLFNIKSHLQAWKDWKKAEERGIHTAQLKEDDILPPVNQRAQGSSSPSTFNINRSNTSGAEACGNLHLLVENPQAAAEKFEGPEKISGQITNEAVCTSVSKPAVKPTLLPLFPTCEWPKYLHARGRNKSID